MIDETTIAPGRVQRAGAGRPLIEVRDPTLRHDLEALIEPTSRGDPPPVSPAE